MNDNNKYEPKDLPSHMKMKEDIPMMELFFRINKYLTYVGLGSSSLRKSEVEIEKLKSQAKDLMEYPTKYNRYFSENGWIAHDSMNFEVIKSAVDNFEKNNSLREAEKIIMDYYSPENIEPKLMYLRVIPEFSVRMKFIKYALKDYKEERYYSSIPIVLMMIDGIVSDVFQKGFHAEKLNTNVWDSLTATDTGIEVIKQHFQKSRKKTTTEVLDFPFRHGILHGRDLAYDNFKVTCKSWAFLFYVKDWVNSKKSENRRIKTFNEKSKTKSFSELAEDLRNLDKLKDETNKWKPRSISNNYLENVTQNGTAEINQPEVVVFEFLKLWKQRNYGKMAELFSNLITDNPQKYAAEVRNLYSINNLMDFKFVKIVDEASAISEVDVELTFANRDTTIFNFRCIYEKGKFESLPRNLPGAKWKIIWAR